MSEVERQSDTQNQGAPEASTETSGGPESQGSALSAVEAALGTETAEEGGARPESEPEDGGKPREEVAAELEKPEGQPEKPEGALDLDPPKGLSAKAQERFESITKGYQELDQRYRTLEAEHGQAMETYGELVRTIQDTGATNEEFARSVDYLALVHSEEPADLERALALLDAERAGLAVRLGRPLDGTPDPLERHPDLKQAVDNLDMTAEVAKEMALLRERDAHMRTRTAETARTQAEQEAEAARAQQTSQIVQHVAQQLEQMAAQWQRTDLGFPQKYEFLKERVPTLIQAYWDPSDPQRFTAAVQHEYDQITRMLESTQPRRTGGHRQPISGTHGAGEGAAPEPKSALDAVNQRLGVG